MRLLTLANGFHLFMILLSLWALLQTFKWVPAVQRFPFFAAAAILVCSLGQIVIQWMASRRKSDQSQKDAANIHSGIDGPEMATSETTPAWVGPAWAFGTILVVLALGIPIGLPLMLALICRYAFDEGWLLSFIMAAGAWLLIRFVFDGIFGAILFEPIFMEWLK